MRFLDNRGSSSKIIQIYDEGTYVNTCWLWCFLLRCSGLGKTLFRLLHIERVLLHLPFSSANKRREERENGEANGGFDLEKPSFLQCYSRARARSPRFGSLSKTLFFNGSYTYTLLPLHITCVHVPYCVFLCMCI